MNVWKVFSTIPPASGPRISSPAAFDVFDCPYCGALVPRDRVQQHEKWHEPEDEDG